MFQKITVLVGKAFSVGDLVEALRAENQSQVTFTRGLTPPREPIYKGTADMFFSSCLSLAGDEKGPD